VRVIDLNDLKRFKQLAAKVDLNKLQNGVKKEKKGIISSRFYNLKCKSCCFFCSFFLLFHVKHTKEFAIFVSCNKEK
jgi:hypothetical protein